MSSLLRSNVAVATGTAVSRLTGLARVAVLGAVLGTPSAVADAYEPFAANQITFTEALEKGQVPMRGFMLKQTRQSDLALFSRMAKIEPGLKPEQVPFRVLVPAFVTSELKSAFQIGFLIFIPFLVIDMIVASVLMSLGMMMLSPVLVALPFKLMLFVLADGWNLIIGSLAASFAT